MLCHILMQRFARNCAYIPDDIFASWWAYQGQAWKNDGCNPVSYGPSSYWFRWFMSFIAELNKSKPDDPYSQCAEPSKINIGRRFIEIQVRLSDTDSLQLDLLVQVPRRRRMLTTSTPGTAPTVTMNGGSRCVASLRWVPHFFLCFTLLMNLFLNGLRIYFPSTTTTTMPFTFRHPTTHSGKFPVVLLY